VKSLLSCASLPHRRNPCHPGQHQPDHPDEDGPEEKTFFTSSFFPNAPITQHPHLLSSPAESSSAGISFQENGAPEIGEKKKREEIRT